MEELNVALTRWQTNSAEQPVDTIVGHPQSRAEQSGDINSAEQPVDTIVGRPESRAEQPEDINSAAQPVDISASSVRSVVQPDRHSPEDVFDMHMLKDFSGANKPHAADTVAVDVEFRTVAHNTAVGKKILRNSPYAFAGLI